MIISDPIYDNGTKTNYDRDAYLDVDVHGSESFTSQIRQVISRFRKVFSNTLPGQPAIVTPLNLDIDVREWAKPVNQAPHRRQSTSKDAEILNQTHVMLDELLQRVGQKHPKFFGKMDLTNGYHQMPLSADSREYTAFRTTYGLYELLRVPMGLKNEASYFQQFMATEVLTGLVGVDCELYLDDILIHAQTEAQFMERLENVLARFQARGLVFSSKKCSFGMEEVKLLGHTINETGSHFSRQKLNTVLKFKLPSTGSQMHSFVALCHYYREHVNRIAELER